MSRLQAPGERSLPRKAVIAAALPLALLAAVIIQLTIVNRLPLPGGDAPDLVLLLVAAVAVRASPLTATFTGFAGGLALDLAPPQTHYAGEYALIFCLAAYAAARVAAIVRDGAGDGSRLTSLVIMAAAAAAGEAGKAALGLLLSDPSVTGPAIRHVLPGAVLYDLLLCPVVLGLAALVAGRPAAEQRVPRPEFAAAGRLTTVFRLASAGAAPGLRLVGSGPVHRGPSWARRQPRLRLSDARSRSVRRTNGAGSPTAQPLLAGGRAAKLHFSAHGRSPAPARLAKTPSRGWLSRDRARRPAPYRRSSPSRGWLRSSRRQRGRGMLGGSRPGAGNWYASAPSSTWLRRRRRPWYRRGTGRSYLQRGPVPYVSRPYPTRRRSYRRRLFTLVGGRR